MKKIIFFIPFLTLALILGFTPACERAVSTNETELTDEALDESEAVEIVEEATAKDKIAIQTKR